MRHASEQELILLVDRELNPLRAAELRAHLEDCWNCRERLEEIEAVMADYTGASRNRTLPPAAEARALLQAQLHLQERRKSATLGVALLAFAATLALVINSPLVRRGSADLSEPKNTLTPGETRAITIGDVCRGESVNESPIVPVSLQEKVFQEYGIAAAHPNRYEVDYLITPALGGADSIRNLWPQPYSTEWNAHVKDALEDRLHDLVCQGKVDLRTAQREISTDWIAAYKKYFHTSRPLQNPG